MARKKTETPAEPVSAPPEPVSTPAKKEKAAPKPRAAKPKAPALEGEPLSAAFDGDAFHAQKLPLYSGALGWAVNKKAEHMAQVRYTAPHHNPHEAGARAGSGTGVATWILGEEHGQAEGHFHSGFEVMLEMMLEPGASLGLHWHDHTEEVLYLLKGSLSVTTLSRDGEEHTDTLNAGDAHLVKLGQGHTAQAGRYGARFLAVTVRR